jgi:hypothetical protein
MDKNTIGLFWLYREYYDTPSGRKRCNFKFLYLDYIKDNDFTTDYPLKCRQYGERLVHCLSYDPLNKGFIFCNKNRLPILLQPIKNQLQDGVKIKNNAIPDDTFLIYKEVFNDYL